ncbi:hypothetical protein [Fulvivirga sp.]|uniref:hypothetical protein n=1 Tax=Fulvivirga sp. TaxID=1931237 RepID=UPI0032EC4A08
MGFVCKFQLNNGEIQDSDVVTFLEYVDESFGDYHKDQVKIARVEFNGQETFVYSTCPCFPSGKTNLTRGQQIDKNTVIGYFATEGEDIPYDKPYARIERL